MRMVLAILALASNGLEARNLDPVIKIAGHEFKDEQEIETDDYTIETLTALTAKPELFMAKRSEILDELDRRLTKLAEQKSAEA